MPSADLSDWYAKPDAARALGISEHTLDRMTARGEGPERRERPRQGKRPEPVFCPTDVDALVAAKTPVRVMPGGDALATTPTGELTLGARELLAVLERMAAAIAQRPAPLALAPPEASKGPWLTLRQASAHTGLSVALLRRLVRQGDLPAIRDRALKVSQGDLSNVSKFLPVATMERSELRP